MRRGCLSFIKECEGNSDGYDLVEKEWDWWRLVGVVWNDQAWAIIGKKVCALSGQGWLMEEVDLKHGRWVDNSRSPEGETVHMRTIFW